MEDVMSGAASVAVSYQALFNVAMGFILILIGYVLRMFRESISDLHVKHENLVETDRRIAQEMAAVRELVAGKYPTREELTACITRLEGKLDTIFAELKSKQDKT